MDADWSMNRANTSSGKCTIWKEIFTNEIIMTTKLHQLQCKVGAIRKESKNPFYNSAFFDINQLIAVLKPLLEEIGLTITQPLQVLEGKNVLTTIVEDSEKGTQISISQIILPDNIDPQKMGSAITYYRRYSLQSLLLLEAEDDDGNSTKPAYTVNNQGNIDYTKQCTCGGSISVIEGISKTTKKPYIKNTCDTCGKVTWG
jgi:hypothetical protein